MAESVITSLPVDVGMESRIGGRSENQDSYGYASTTRGLLLVVCDGMGGGPCGSFASKTAVGAIIDAVTKAEPNQSDNDVVIHAIESANSALRQAIQEDNSLSGMGTTAVVLLIGKDNVVIGHVGDSRCYHIRHKKLLFKTKDHSKVGELVKMGVLTEEQARLSSESNVITRALGTKDTCDVEIDCRPYEKGDRFILCSDGIWGSMPEKQLIRILSKSPSVLGTAESVAITVDDLGNGKGGHHDNLTLIIAEVKLPSSSAETKWLVGSKIIPMLSFLLLMSIVLNVALMCNRSKDNGDSSHVQSIDTVSIDNSSVDLNSTMIKKYEDSIKSLNNRLQKYKETSIKREIVSASMNATSEEIDKIISKLEKLKKMRKSVEKNQLIENAKSDLRNLKTEKQFKEEINKCVELLNAKIAKEDPVDKEQGHYNAIIRQLKSLKNKL